MKSQQLSVLHVEDDDVDSMMVEHAFKKINFNYSLSHARSGVEALDMLRGTNGENKISPPPKIILLDLNMPRMNGLEFLKELRSDNELQALSVFVLTTSADSNDIASAYHYNVGGYILKPYSIENFVSTFETLKSFWELCVYPN